MAEQWLYSQRDAIKITESQVNSSHLVMLHSLDAALM